MKVGEMTEATVHFENDVENETGTFPGPIARLRYSYVGRRVESANLIPAFTCRCRRGLHRCAVSWDRARRHIEHDPLHLEIVQ
jgi:hypothetical protein